jgi:pimeloyl-ACP methyl ester carboxylesterase
MTLPERRTIELAHGRVAWREAGDCPALVLLHGLNGNAASWVRQFGALAGRFRVVGRDAPSYGGSDPHPQPGTESYADAVAGMLDALGTPILAICGGDNTIARPACLDEIASTAAAARGERIDGVAHAAYIEAPERYNALLVDFLD